jgi:crotonobetainyl-CoA:carnitine CoA-transferase CaiB-like acyl-CoA transferase
LVGQHTIEVLSEVGMSDDEIAVLRTDGSLFDVTYP